jgi:hypothetical protein
MPITLGKTKNKNEIKEEIANYLKEQILQDVGSSKSPVTGKKFKALSKDYKKFKDGVSSSNVPNLELYGDMLNHLDFNITSKGIEIGIFDFDQAQKADNHCKFSAKSLKTKVPERQFIPRKDEEFRPAIMNKIKKLVKDGSEN